MSERVDLSGDVKAAMSLGQLPLAMSSGVGLSGWAMLQWGQDIISEVVGTVNATKKDFIRDWSLR